MISRIIIVKSGDKFRLDSSLRTHTFSFFNLLLFCFSFFVLVLVYLVGGVLYMRFVRGATGVEQIPQLEFWKGLPGAAKVNPVVQ